MITVAICTYNRSPLLDRTLARLAEIKPPTLQEWEVIVVNNRCTDNTDDVIERYVTRLPLQRIYQPESGLSNARNAAIDTAHGEYILWTDDDVLVGDDWLIAYEEAFARRPEAAVFGGPVLPWFEVEPPRWLHDNWDYLSFCYAVRDLGGEEFALDYAHNLMPFGANYCVRRSEQLLHRYNPALGRNQGKTVLGEESEVMKALFDDGATGWWVPRASVRHWIPSGRMTKTYLRDYFQGIGRTEAVLDPPRDNVSSIGGVPRWIFRQLIEEGLRYGWRWMFGDTRQALEAMRKFEYYRGYQSGLRGQQ
jgi:glycosyltransferase involved in cell wall biosynthesis